jgi:hypothetical protein
LSGKRLGERWDVGANVNYDRYEAERNLGYSPEFARNMLQLNNGTYTLGDTAVPFFSEIGQMAGVSETDWSWSVLLADYNNDGWKDMHITNGIGRDFINADFLEFSHEAFNTIADKKDQQKTLKQKLASLKHINLSNYLYLNNGDYFFKDISKEAGIDEPSMSNGAAYADLDNDGDMDLVINNSNEYALYILGSAEVVGLMCLKVFCNGDENSYNALKHAAMKLGSAFQKINFLRDLQDDLIGMGRNYFPGLQLKRFDEQTKIKIADSIKKDLEEGVNGIKKLPRSSRFGVYVAYVYYLALFNKIRNTPSEMILNRRIRIRKRHKATLLAYSYVKHQLNLI